MTGTQTLRRRRHGRVHGLARLGEGKRSLGLSGRDYGWPLLFLLSMSMCGLSFYPMLLVLFAIMLNRFKNDSYDFAIMTAIFLGNYALIGEDTLFVKTSDIALAVSLIGLAVFRKTALLKKMVLIWAVYCATLFALACFSDESLSVQVRLYRYVPMFITIFIWLMIFSGEKFDMHLFFRRLAPYVFIICAFYCIDCYIINGHVLVPHSFAWGGQSSTFYQPVLYGFGSMPRKYPPGLYWLALFMFPLARYYRMSLWQWAVVLLALFASRTFTVISGLIVTYLVSMPGMGRTMRYVFIAAVTLCALYWVDSMIPSFNDNGESQLRIKSSIDQITNLGNAQDDEDLSEVGSGRLGQAMPKLALMYAYGKEWTGMGFLHPQYTKSTKYVIDNEYYTDIEQSEEVATGVEIEPVQVLLYVGYIGLAAHLIFLILTWSVIRRCRYSRYYLSVLLCLFWFGLGGFAGLLEAPGLILLSLAWTAVYLSSRNPDEGKELEEKTER